MYNGGFGLQFRPSLGGRPTVGHVALDHGIGVRIPASQPTDSESIPKALLACNSTRKQCDASSDRTWLLASAALVRRHRFYRGDSCRCPRTTTGLFLKPPPFVQSPTRLPDRPSCTSHSTLVPFLAHQDLSQSSRQEDRMARVRRQAAVIPYRIRKARLEVALVTTSKGNGWIVPKGCIDEGERARDAAIREAEEEAGLRGVVAAEAGRAVLACQRPRALPGRCLRDARDDRHGRVDGRQTAPPPLDARDRRGRPCARRACRVHP